MSWSNQLTVLRSPILVSLESLRLDSHTTRLREERYLYMYIYICMYMYMYIQCTTDKASLKEIPVPIMYTVLGRPKAIACSDCAHILHVHYCSLSLLSGLIPSSYVSVAAKRSLTVGSSSQTAGIVYIQYFYCTSCLDIDCLWVHVVTGALCTRT